MEGRGSVPDGMQHVYRHAAMASRQHAEKQLKGWCPFKSMVSKLCIQMSVKSFDGRCRTCKGQRAARQEIPHLCRGDLVYAADAG